MLTTIEEKLSAIKAINEEIHLMDTYLARLATIETPVHGHVNYFVKDEVKSFLVPVAITPGLNILLNEYYTTRRDQLIAKATELMK